MARRINHEEKIQKCVRFPKQLHDDLMEIAEHERLPFATIVVRLLRDYLEKSGGELTEAERRTKEEIEPELASREYQRFLRALIRDEIEKWDRKYSSKR
ncbi:MAG: hypothetical protein QMD46_12775 [Methanomicrobiales archaeon]|nr:hypothetical protein [Methanomicrobiales archaeon]